MTEEGSVRVGLYLPQVALSADALLERARVADDCGLDSLWFYDHLYSPGQPDRDSFEAWTTAAFVLARTERLRVGHLVLDNNFRHPALLAKMVTSLDVLSAGRIEVGIGSGSVELEHDQLGIAWGSASERAERLDEGLAILTDMLAEPMTSFEGRHYRIDAVPNLPRPVQSPRPPIHVGGVGPRLTLPLAARFADVWNVPTYGLADWEDARRQLDRHCEAIGRDPATLATSLEAVLVLVPDDGALDDARALAARRYGSAGWGLEAGGFIGTPPMIAERIRQLADKGVSLFVFITHDRGNPRTIELLGDAVLPGLP
jgi:alkanesulfonate monooxygenase SsuD/methylene tetrahydromethanopterin reductase-like flavin-dependent oxidoreductase (luciferase family)